MTIYICESFKRITFEEQVGILMSNPTDTFKKKYISFEYKDLKKRKKSHRSNIYFYYYYFFYVYIMLARRVLESFFFWLDPFFLFLHFHLAYKPHPHIIYDWNQSQIVDDADAAFGLFLLLLLL